MTPRLWLSALGAVLERDAIVYISYRSRWISQVMAVSFNLVIFYYLSHLVRVDSFQESSAYFAFVVVGLFILQVLTSTLGQGPSAIRQELVAGTLERFIVSPFGAVSGALAMLVFPLISAMLLGTLTIAVATVFFGLPLHAATAPLAIPVAMLGACAFMPFAILFSAMVMAFKQSMTGSQFIVAGMAIVGGLYFPVTLLPEWIQWAQHVQPFTPAADLLRHLLVETPLREAAWLSLLKLTCFAGVLFPVSIWVLGRAVHFGQRRGTIIEY